MQRNIKIPTMSNFFAVVFIFFEVSVFFSIPAAPVGVSVRVLASPTLLSFAKRAAGLRG